MISQHVRLIAERRQVVATAQVVEQNGTFAGGIDLSPMPEPLQQLFEEYEEIVNTHMFSLLDEVERGKTLWSYNRQEDEIMAIPTKALLYRPILEIVRSASGSLSDKHIASLLSDQFELTDAERRTMIPSGVQSKIENRTGWAVAELKYAGLVHYPSRGRRAITPPGREFLGRHEGEITDAHLRQCRARSQHAETNKLESAMGDSLQSSADATPEELMEDSDRQIRDKLADELLENITALSPGQFERLVVNLVEKMGYGKGQQVGGSGDGGIDGIINQDPLGLEKVYIQAKRWSNQIGDPEIRNFAGSLDAKGATKGVFITNSTFNGTATQTAAAISTGAKSIRLINGRELAELMIEHSVGVVTERTYEVKKVDENYFAEND